MNLFISAQKRLFPNLKETILRFPIPFACVIIFTLSSFLKLNNIVLIGLKNDPTAWFNIPLFCVFFAFIALKLFVENHTISSKHHALLTLGISAILIYACFTINIVNLLLLLVGLNAILLVAPCILNDSDEVKCCYFNTRLGINIFFAVVSAIILCGGTSLIFLSIKYLFELKISGNTYLNTWLIGMSFFAPLYVLAGIPKGFTDEQDAYPKGVSFILSYIVAPLILIYFIILYAYIVKILIGQQLPKGKVAYMVTSFGTIGIFTHLLSYALKDTGNMFIRMVQKYFYYALLAPIALLFIGVGKRINDYGITEERYIVVMLALWFLASALYIIFKKNPKLKVILLLIGAMLIASSFGIWGAESVSVRSQVARLKAILERNNVLVDGKIVKTSELLSTNEQSEIFSTLHYIIERRKIDAIKLWFDSDSYINTTKDKRHNTGKIFEDMGLKHSAYSKRSSNYFSYSYYGKIEQNTLRPVEVKKFDIYVDVAFAKGMTSWPKIIGSKEKPNQKLELYIRQDGIVDIKYPSKNTKLQLDLREIVKSLLQYGKDNNALPESKREVLVITKENNGLKVKACIKNISGTIKNGEPDISYANIEMLVKYPE